MPKFKVPSFMSKYTISVHSNVAHSINTTRLCTVEQAKLNLYAWKWHCICNFALQQRRSLLQRWGTLICADRYWDSTTRQIKSTYILEWYSTATVGCQNCKAHIVDFTLSHSTTSCTETLGKFLSAHYLYHQAGNFVPTKMRWVTLCSWQGNSMCAPASTVELQKLRQELLYVPSESEQPERTLLLFANYSDDHAL